MIGLFKVMSEYGRAEGLGMIVVSVVVAMMITTDVLNLEEPVVTKQMVEEAPETDLDEGIENEEKEEDTQDDTLEVIEEVINFQPIEPVYDTIEVIEEIIEEVPQYDTLEVIEIESNEMLDVDSLLTVYKTDSLEIEVME